jgi:hypothetical protein
LNLNATFDDQIVGRYELQRISTQDGEPTSPLKPQTNLVRTIGCGAAGELSVLSYVDLATNPLGSKEQAAVARSRAETKLLRQVAKQATKKVAAKSAAALLTPEAVALATAVDVACRATAPRTDWGTVRSQDKKEEEKPSGPPSTPQVMAQK